MFKSFALAILAAIANAQDAGTVASVTANADGTTNTVTISVDDGTTETIDDLPIDIAVAEGDSISQNPSTGELSINGTVVDYTFPTDDGSGDVADDGSGDVADSGSADSGPADSGSADSGPADSGSGDGSDEDGSHSENIWSSGIITNPIDISYEIWTDWQTTGGVDDQTEYAFGLYLDISAFGDFEIGQTIEMAWGIASDEPESVYQKLSVFDPLVWQQLAGVVDSPYVDVFSNAPTGGLHESYLQWPAGDGTDEFTLDTRYTPAPLASWRPLQGWSRLDLASSSLELWFESVAGSALDLKPDNTLFMSMRLTGADGSVLAEQTDIEVEWSAPQPCGEGLERLPSRVDQGGECVAACPATQSRLPSDETTCGCLDTQEEIDGLCYELCPDGETRLFLRDGTNACFPPCAALEDGTAQERDTDGNCVTPCGEGQERIDGAGECVDECESDEERDEDDVCQLVDCPDGQERVGDSRECVAECASDEVRNADGVCELPACAEGTERVGDSRTCVAVCAEGETRGADGVCALPECPEGQTRNDAGECVNAISDTCPDGKVKNDDGDCVDESGATQLTSFALTVVAAVAALAY